MSILTEERICNLEAFAVHYESHVMPHICHGKPLDKGCRFCQDILKEKEGGL